MKSASIFYKTVEYKKKRQSYQHGEQTNQRGRLQGRADAHPADGDSASWLEERVRDRACPELSQRSQVTL